MIKNIAVHLTGSSEDGIRLTYAGELAARLNASITGLQLNVIPEILSITDRDVEQERRPRRRAPQGATGPSGGADRSSPL